MEGILVPISMFAALFGVLYVYFSTRNKERLAMIEKGADASLFKHERNPLGALKWGMLLVGVGLGIVMGNVMETAGVLNEEVAYPAMIAFCGGLFLVIFYFIEKRMKGPFGGNQG
jgi:hypothetical protein